jgi:RNA polymerase sigma-70 factor (ECF subfamily)
MSYASLLAAVPYDDTAAGRVRADESVLIQRIRDGDERALEVVFRSRAPALIRFATRLGVSHASAEEIVTDVVAAVWHSRQRLDPASSLDAYLFRAVRNAAFNARRGDRREIVRVERETERGAQPGLGTPAPPPDAEMEDASTANVVWNAVKLLPERQRTVLYLRYTRELTLAEVAETMETSVPAVKNMLQRAHQTLRRTLGGVFDAL